MGNANPNILVICGAAILVAVVGAAVALAFNGNVGGDAVLALLGSVVAIGGGAIAVHTGVTAGAKAASPPS